MAPCSYIVRGNTGIVQVPRIPFGVVVIIASIFTSPVRALTTAGILAWRIFRDSPTEVSAGSPASPPAGGTGAEADHDTNKQLLVIMAIGRIGLGAFLMVRR